MKTNPQNEPVKPSPLHAGEATLNLVSSVKASRKSKGTFSILKTATLRSRRGRLVPLFRDEHESCYILGYN